MNKKKLPLFALLIFLTSCAPKIKDLTFLNKVPEKYSKEEKNIQGIFYKPTKDMTFSQALIAKEYYETIKNNDRLIKCCERLLAIGGDQEIIRQSTLRLAQTCLEEKNFEKAQKYSQDYQSLYPGSKFAKEAAFINIKSHFLDFLSPEKDQTKTKETIELAENFLKKHKKDRAHKKETISILKKSYQNLIDYEINIAKTYLNRFNYYKNKNALLAAQNRIKHLKEKLLPKLKNQEPKVLEFELALAKAEDNQNLIAQKEQEIKRKFPSIIV